ncbi:peptidoglycan/LPS O-acetylase OafA/YrhL [Flavobacterium sp. W4I14]|nr:peptidoglycan/LPS O-acetylase OafA/YrhL [Flavobacterium sp. W4I14]
MSTNLNNELATKPHYPILDGLRGVAAIIVVTFHLTEPLGTGHLDILVNHGYLAVDFFFLLSGFVMGYAYDDRWNKMSVGSFFKRRIVRLQPMVILGMTLGAIGFYFYRFYHMATHSHYSDLEDATGTAYWLYYPADTTIA